MSESEIRRQNEGEQTVPDIFGAGDCLEAAT